MKSLPVWLNTLLICAVIAMMAAFGLPRTGAQAAGLVQAGANPPAGCDPGRTMQVSGTAVVNVAPDRALIQLGVQSNGVTVDAAQANNDAAVAQIITALKSLGVDAKDIATDRYVIEPIYSDYDSLSIKGYRIHNLIAVTVRDVSKTSALLAAALKAGANQVVNVELYTSELRKYRDQAREMAMKAATEKAQALAGAAGAKAGCVLSVHENTSSYYNGWWGWGWGWGGSRDQWTQNAVQNIAPAASAGGEPGGALSETGPISLGQISIRAEVDASFGLSD